MVLQPLRGAVEEGGFALRLEPSFIRSSFVPKTREAVSFPLCTWWRTRAVKTGCGLAIFLLAGLSGAYPQQEQSATHPGAEPPNAPHLALLSGHELSGTLLSGQSAAPTAQVASSDPMDSTDSTVDVADRQYSPGTSDKASPYVPLDSWIYAAFDKLMAMGYAPSGSTAMRPWSRLECARLLAEAHAEAAGNDPIAAPLFTALDTEFAHETAVIDGVSNRQLLWESAYSRITGIAGTPLRDSYHFGQTLADDFGRPYGQGANEISGLSGWGSAGPFTFYFRGEHQYASKNPLYNPAAQQAIVASDNMFVTGGQMPFGWNLRLGTTDRVRLVDGYVAANLGNWQVSFGQQGLWWGPDRSTSLILSNNASSLPMLRFDRVKPARLPGFLSWFGPLHFTLFFAREGGIHFVGLGPTFQLYGSASKALTPPPYMWGTTLSVKPTPNFEMGFAITTIFAGYGRPLNLKTFLHTFSVTGNGQALDPGKRVTEFSLTYHPPGLRKKLLLYTEGMSWNAPFQGNFEARFAMDPGLYIPHLPGLKNVDFRAEGVYTNLPNQPYLAYFYSNAHYVQGYTNYGQIMGSWIGRQGQGGQATSTYWFSARDKAFVSYRKMTADPSFLQGGNMDDLSAGATWLFRHDLQLTATGQYEHWHFPLLHRNAQTDFATIIGVRYEPRMSFLTRSRH